MSRTPHAARRTSVPHAARRTVTLIICRLPPCGGLVVSLVMVSAYCPVMVSAYWFWFWCWYLHLIICYRMSKDGTSLIQQPGCCGVRMCDNAQCMVFAILCHSVCVHAVNSPPCVSTTHAVHARSPPFLTHHPKSHHPNLLGPTRVHAYTHTLRHNKHCSKEAFQSNEPGLGWR